MKIIIAVRKIFAILESVLGGTAGRRGTRRGGLQLF